MHINIVAHASLPIYYILFLKLRFMHKNSLDKSQMGIYIYLIFSYKFIENSHLNFRPTVERTNTYLLKLHI